MKTQVKFLSRTGPLSRHIGAPRQSGDCMKQKRLEEKKYEIGHDDHQPPSMQVG